MAHQGPCREKSIIQFDSTFEINYSLVMVASQRIVVSDDAARLGTILVIVEYTVRQVGKLSIVLLDVQDVRIQIHVLIPEGIDFSKLLEPIECNIIVQ